MYSSWDMVCDRYDYFSFILDHFLPFYPPNSPKNQTFKKKKNTSRDHQFTYVLQKLWSDGVWFLRYGAWQIWLFFILDHFCPFNPLTTVQKIKILKKWKTFFEILSFYICVPIIMVRWCMVPEIWCMTDLIVVSHFGLIFTFLLPPPPTPSPPPLIAQKINTLKKWKNTWRYHHFTYVNHISFVYDQMIYGFWDMVRNR